MVEQEDTSTPQHNRHEWCNKLKNEYLDRITGWIRRPAVAFYYDVDRVNDFDYSNTDDGEAPPLLPTMKVLTDLFKSFSGLWS